MSSRRTMSSTRTNVVQQGPMSSKKPNVIQEVHVIDQDHVIQQGPMPCGCQEAPMSYGLVGQALGLRRPLRPPIFVPAEVRVRSKAL